MELALIAVYSSVAYSVHLLLRLLLFLGQLFPTAWRNLVS